MKKCVLPDLQKSCDDIFTNPLNPSLLQLVRAMTLLESCGYLDSLKSRTLNEYRKRMTINLYYQSNSTERDVFKMLFCANKWTDIALRLQYLTEEHRNKIEEHIRGCFKQDDFMSIHDIKDELKEIFCNQAHFLLCNKCFKPN
jgi:hypothetical protein